MMQWATRIIIILLLPIVAAFFNQNTATQTISAEMFFQKRAFLPNLDKRYPPPPPSIVIDYVPPFDAWYHPANPNPESIGRGRILNHDVFHFPNVVIFYLTNEDVGWRQLTNSTSCNPPPPPIDPSPINCATGDFSFAFGRLLVNEVTKLRFYLVSADYIYTVNEGGFIQPPPNPPVAGVAAMTEVSRGRGNWQVVSQLP